MSKHMRDETKLIPNIEGKFTYNGVNYDQRKGIGAVGQQSQVNYEGYTVFMNPYDFLKLNPVREDKLPETIINRIKNGEPIASPWLYVKIEDDGSLRITSHEGRGRAAAISSIYGDDTEMPVNIFIRYLPANHIPEGTVLREIWNDKRTNYAYYFEPKIAIWKKELVTI